ncbi:MAG: FtsK/SpoIIIE domain-containing protein [Planctomycetota bacterium]
MTASPDPAVLDPTPRIVGGPAVQLARPLVVLQREALAGLAELAERHHHEHAAAATEYERRIARLDARRENTLQRATDRYRLRRRVAKASAAAELEALQCSHDEERRRFEQQAAEKRDQIAAETRDVQKKATADLEYERWAAGSIFEGSLAKLKQWSEDQARQSELARRRFQEIDRGTQEVLVRFRMPDLAAKLAEPHHSSNTDEPEDSNAATEVSADHPFGAVETKESSYPDAFDSALPLAWTERVIQASIDSRESLARLPLARLFVGEMPWVLATTLVICGAAAGLLLPGQFGETELGPPLRIMIGGCVSLFIAIGLWWLLFRMARQRVSQAMDNVQAERNEFRDSVDAFEAWSQDEYGRVLSQSRDTRDAALLKADETFGPVIERLRYERRQQIDSLDQRLESERIRLTEQLNTASASVRKDIDQDLQARDERAKRREAITRSRHERDTARASDQLAIRRAGIDREWAQQRDDALGVIADIDKRAATEAPDWSEPFWSAYQPPSQPLALSPFGTLRCQPRHILQHPDADALGLPEAFSLTATLSTPGPRSWLIEAEPGDREVALSAMRSLLLRLLTTQPPGQVRLTLLDPVGLGESFAGLMHLADYDERLVNSRVWSEPPQMEQRLVDLTDHMSVVIQKYLRNDFQTIEAYNAQAGELAEPYRFLVVADFPHGLSDDGLARLSSIASSGARCGVFVLLLRDARQTILSALNDDLFRHCVAVRRERLNPGDASGWRIVDDVLGELPLSLDQAPDDGVCSTILHRIGAAAVDAERVQVPFESITPSPEVRWSADSSEELRVPIGRTGATRLQDFALGPGVAQHALIAGKTGSGKSSLLHALVTNLALWYPPEQLELYLIDFKKGVEFKPYVTHRLPHARAIAIESDRAFGLSILRELDRLMDERGERFRKAGVQILAQYRKACPDEPMPRVLLVVDEFQELFSRDDQLAQDAALLLDRVVRQGRAFGVHALLGSQSLSGAAGLARGTMGQMAVRIALQCNEADSQLILGDENSAARLLNRPGEAIYNARGGDLEGNAVFQVAWLPEDQHAESLRQVNALREERQLDPLPRAVFEGSAPAMLGENGDLNRMLASMPESPRVPVVYVGEPIAIEAPTAVRLPREPGSHALIVGGAADTVMPLFTSAVLSLAAQHPPDDARFVVLNGSSEPEHDEHFQQLAEDLRHRITVTSPRRAAEQLQQVHGEMKHRLDADEFGGTAVYLLLFGLQRFRDFRKQEDTFSFSSLDDDRESNQAVAPDRALGELLRDGPPLGFHTFVWADRAASVDPVFDRRDMREIDSRILFQMSANDSAQIMDGTDANELGPYRALLQREDRGTVTRFRPYGPIDRAWLNEACAKLRSVQMS